MSSFDPMATAVDWLDAYRNASPSILDLYAHDASLVCCKGHATLVGRGAIGEYWRQRFVDQPAGELQDLQTQGDAIVVSYSVPGETLQVILTFNDSGEILESRCGPDHASPELSH